MVVSPAGGEGKGGQVPRETRRGSGGRVDRGLQGGTFLPCGVSRLLNYWRDHREEVLRVLVKAEPLTAMP